MISIYIIGTLCYIAGLITMTCAYELYLCCKGSGRTRNSLVSK